MSDAASDAGFDVMEFEDDSDEDEEDEEGGATEFAKKLRAANKSRDELRALLTKNQMGLPRRNGP